MLENYILQSNETHRILHKYKHIKLERDIDIRGSPSLGYVHPKQLVLPFYYPTK